MNKRFIIYFLFLILIVSCNSQVKLPTIPILINGHKLIVEVASTDEQRKIGLMYRKELKENEGMLFVFPSDLKMAFWMKNTYIPLSIAFILSNGKIIQIENLKPLDETTIFSNGLARYALEVPQGIFKKLEIKMGDFVIFPSGSP